MSVTASRRPPRSPDMRNPVDVQRWLREIEDYLKRMMADIAAAADEATAATADKVSGPDGATDNALVRYDGETGRLVQSSTVTLSDVGVLAGVRIGPWTSNADASVNGFIVVRDNNGNSRKIATIA